MTSEEFTNKFNEIADAELSAALRAVPEDPMQRALILIEVMRVLDYTLVFSSHAPRERQLPSHELELIRWGWNYCLSHVFSGLVLLPGIPLMESTERSRGFAYALLRQLGVASLMKRTAEMVKAKIVSVERNSDEFVVRMGPDAKSQFLDEVEKIKDIALVKELPPHSGAAESSWKYVDKGWLERSSGETGSYFFQDDSSELDCELQADVSALMIPLIQPWKTNRGTMVGYGAIPEVDRHFLALAAKQTRNWVLDAGFHSDAKLKNTTAKDILAVTVYMISLHLKHISFVLLAPRVDPEISVPQSLTIWGPRAELEDSFCDFSGLDKDRVKHAFDAITLTADDAEKLRAWTTPFIPMLVDLGNGYILRPVSAIYVNPFQIAKVLAGWRDPNAVNQLSVPLESWMRDQVYSLFKGSRYSRVDGNIKLRKDGRILTDIDGAVLDRTTGDLAIFQFKWQDYSTNDVKSLRSKATNLSLEMDAWASSVVEWISDKSMADVSSSFRFSLRADPPVRRIFLFGVSSQRARVQGFGRSVTNAFLAVCTFAHFSRVRHEVGPVEDVFGKLHEVLHREMTADVDLIPIPVTIAVGGESIRFENLWNGLVEPGDELISKGSDA